MTSTEHSAADAAENDFDELRGFHLFEGVEAGLADSLIANCTSLWFKPGELIFEQDNPLTRLMIISRGLVDLSRIEGTREFGVLLLAAHDLLLPGAALFDEPCLLSARALTRTKICGFPADVILGAMSQSARLSFNLLSVTSGQWRMSVRNTLDASTRTAAQRVGAFLLRLADLQPHTSPAFLPISKRHLSSRLGITPETLSRVLQNVAEHGLYLRGRMIFVRDREQIERFCGPDPYIARDERELGVFAL
ncbi:helix-turn-helix domain-containing protein [Sphingomonas sp. KRR8]|uniref:helix-turn-helix domain-containing protein n=1 Tax=Sphingomonas sp. KRR8 TaxID=2942996 RepID=UPI00201FF977|nr:helix-turn-helix domain-containing protein [Sphingomonas sp. KRR8]URD61849.1 helix-turn-helix domain-containing protein [Sphingomonas sp. KRR8]